jgi:hypothetical protein
MAYVCPGLFPGFREDFTEATAIDTILISESSCPPEPLFRAYECTVFVKNAQGLAKGTVGNFQIKLVPVSVPGDNPGVGTVSAGGSVGGSGGPGGPTGVPTTPPVPIDVPSGTL